MIDIETLIAEATANEPKTIYDMHKASCDCPVPTECNCVEEWDTLTFNGGGTAHAVVLGKTITLTYADGTVASYTEV